MSFTCECLYSDYIIVSVDLEERNRSGVGRSVRGLLEDEVSG